MKKSSALKILRSFSKKEMEEFRDFLISPIHNKKSMVVKLFDVIRESAPEFTDESLEKETLWKKIYPDKAYNYGVMKNLIHDLTKLAENFISFKNYANSNSFSKNLLESLLNRNLEDLFEIRLEKFKKTLDNVETELDIMSIKGDLLFYYNLRSFNKESSTYRVDINDEISVKEDYCTLLFVNTLLHFYAGNASLNINIELDYFKSLLKSLFKNSQGKVSSPVLKVYSIYFECVEDIHNKNKFDILLNEFRNCKGYLNRIDEIKMYNSMSLIYELKHRSGDKQYEEEYLKHFIELIDKGFHSTIPDLPLDLITYRNVIVVCRRNSNTDIMEKFIKAALGKVHPVYKDALLNYSYASLHNLKGNFQEVLEYGNKTIFNGLMETDKDNLYFKNDIKMMSVRACYELKNYENVFTQVDAYRHFIKNTALLPDKLKNMRFAFLRNLNELTKLSLDYDEFLLQKLENSVQKEIENSWLLKKINKLRKENETDLIVV